MRIFLLDSPKGKSTGDNVLLAQTSIFSLNNEPEGGSKAIRCRGLLSGLVSNKKTTSGKVGNLLLVFHFPTPRRGGGNVGIAQRFPRAVGKDGKPGFGFPRFPRARHFHGPPRFHLGAPLVLEAGE